jgi:hypothetical protein
MDRREAEQVLARLLLEHIERDQHPSATQMNLLEHSMTPDIAEEYVEVLLGKLRDAKWPSLDLLKRAQRVAATLPQAA